MNLLSDNLYTVFVQETAPDFLLVGLSWNARHPLFSGHFPSHPVVPGACLIQVIRELAEYTAGCPLSLEKVKNVKFLKVIDPVAIPLVNARLQLLRQDHLLTVKALVETPQNVFCKMELCLKKSVVV